MRARKGSGPVLLAAAGAVGLFVVGQPARDVAGEEGDDYDYEAERLAHGIPCPERMPGGGRWPIEGTCFEHSTVSVPPLTLVFWMRNPRDAEYYDPAGVVIEDARFPKSEPFAVHLDAEADCGVELHDVSRDAVEDVVISCPTYLGDTSPRWRRDEPPGLLYTFVIRDKKGMYEGPTIRLVSPVLGDGKLDDVWYDERSPSEAHRWRWKGKTAGLVEEPLGATALEGLTAKASSFSAKAYAPAMAVDGRPETTWAAKGVGVGQTLTVTFPRVAKVVRVFFTAGFAHESEKLGDLFELNDHIEKARLKVGSGPEVVLVPGEERWLGWVAERPVKAKSLTITIDAVARGTKWRDTCISEVEVWE